MFKDNLFLYMSMFCCYFQLLHLTPHSLLPSSLVVVVVVFIVVIIALFEFTNSSEVPGRGFNLPGQAVKDPHGHEWLGGAPHQNRLAAESTLETGNLQG